jgi:DNA-binding PadR family transcriptional regulator
MTNFSPSKVQYNVVKGNLTEIVLAMIHTHKEMHGYAIITEIRKHFHCYIGPSTLYPMLTSMVKDGLLTSDWSVAYPRPRKNYTLTNKGISLLKTYEVSVQMISPGRFQMVLKQ